MDMIKKSGLFTVHFVSSEPLIGWDLFDFFSETESHTSSKLQI